MTEMTERERAIEKASKEASWLPTGKWFAAMYDALQAYDAARVDAAYKQALATDAPDPVATVREALQVINGTPRFQSLGVIRRDGCWTELVGGGHQHKRLEESLVAILNALPALLERAERDAHWPNMVKAQGNLRPSLREALSVGAVLHTSAAVREFCREVLSSLGD